MSFSIATDQDRQDNRHPIFEKLAHCAHVRAEISGMSVDNFLARPHRRHVEKYGAMEASHDPMHPAQEPAQLRLAARCGATFRAARGRSSPVNRTEPWIVPYEPDFDLLADAQRFDGRSFHFLSNH
jgi:hypothetical protein